MRLDIEPLVGVGDLKFGITKEQVAALLGPPDDHIIDDGELREYRRDNGMQLVYIGEGAHLVELGFSPNVKELEFGKVKLFEADPEQVLTLLNRTKATAYECFGFLVFLDLGITLTGFHDGHSEQMAITAFTAGRWDAMKEDLKPIDF